MLPSVNNLLTTELIVETEPSKNYRMKFEQNSISG